MMGSSVGNQEVGPSDRILAPSRRAAKARRVASCSARSSVSIAKRQRWHIVLTVAAFLIVGTVAQQEGSSVVSPPGMREVSSASLVSRHSTEAWRGVEQDLQNPSTGGQPDWLAVGINPYTRNSVADPVGTTVPVYIASTSWDPSKASALLSSSYPVDKNGLEVLDLAASSLGGELAETGTSLDASSKGLRESTVAISVVKPVEKGKPGLLPTISPTSPLLPDAGSSLHLDGTSALQTTLAHSLRDAAPSTVSSVAQPTAATALTSPKPPAAEGSPQGEQDLTGTSQPLTTISHQIHLDQKSTSHSGDVLPSTEMGFPTHQPGEEAPSSPEMLGMSLSNPTLPMETVPSEATHGATFHSSSVATTHSFGESTLRVSTGMHSGSFPATASDISSRSTALLQEAVLNGQGSGGPDLAPRDPSESTTAPIPLPQSSSWPFSSSSHGVARVPFPDFVTQLDSLENKGLASDSLTWHQLVPTSTDSPKLDDATVLSTSMDGGPVTAEKDTEVPLSITSPMEESETHYGVSEGTVPSVQDLATVSALTVQQTLSDLSTTQDLTRSEAISRFPVGNASFVTQLDSSETKGLATDYPSWHQSDPTSTDSPKLDDATALSTSMDGDSVTAKKDTEVPLSVTSPMEELETRYGVSEGTVPSVQDLATVSALTVQQTLSDLSTPQELTRSEAISRFPVGNASFVTQLDSSETKGLATDYPSWHQSDPTSTDSPKLDDATALSTSMDGDSVTAKKDTEVPLSVTSPMEELETRDGVSEGTVPSVPDLVTGSVLTDQQTLSDVSTPQDFPRLEATSGFPIGNASFVTQLDSSETKGLATHYTSWHQSVPTSTDSPKLDEATALSTSMDGGSAMAKKDTEVPLSITSPMEESETHDGVSEGMVPSVPDLVTGSALTDQQTLSDMSTPQDFLRSEATSGFPIGNGSFVTQLDSSETKGLATDYLSWHQSLPTNTESPKSDEATALSTSMDGDSVTAKKDTEVPLSVTSPMEELETRYGVSEGTVPSIQDLVTVSALTVQQTLSDLSTPQDSTRSEAASRFPIGNASFVTQLDSSETKGLATDYPSWHQSVPTSTDSPKLDYATALSTSMDGASAMAKKDIDVPLSVTSPMEELETRYGVSEGTVPSVPDLATGSALSDQQTLSDLSTPQDFLRLEATSGFPIGNASFVTQLDSSETKGLATHYLSWHRLIPKSTDSPKLDDATVLSTLMDGASVTAKKDTEVPLSITSLMEESETRYGVSEGTVPSVPYLATGSAVTDQQTLSDLSTPQEDFPKSEATSGFPVGNTSSPASQAPRTDSVSSSSTVNQLELGTTTHSPPSSPARMAGVPLILSTVLLELGTVAADNPTEASPSAHQSTTLGERSTSLGSTSWVRLPASLGTTEEQEGFPATEVIKSPSPDEGTGLEWKEEISPTAELSTGVPGQVSILDGQSEHTSLYGSSTLLPSHASRLPTIHVGHSRGVGTGFTVPFLHSLSTSAAVPSADVTDLGSYREQLQLKDRDGTRQVTAADGKISDSPSDLPLATSGAAVSTDSSSSLTSAMLGVPSAWEHVAFPGKRTGSTSSPPTSSTFLTISRMTTSKESSEPATAEASSISVPTSATRSNATVSSQFLDVAGVTQPFRTTAGGAQQVGMVTGRPTTSTGRELFSRTSSEWRPIPTLPQAVANRTEVLDTTRVVDTSVFFVHSTSYRASSKASVDHSLVETKPTVTSQPKTTQAVSLLPNTTALPASSRILPTASVLTTSVACSDVHCLNNDHLASFAPLQRTPAQLPTTSPPLPKEVLVTTLGSTVGKKGTTAGLSTKMDTPTVTHTMVTHTTALSSVKPGTIIRGGPTSKRLVSPLEASTVAQTAEGHTFTLSKRTLDVRILSLEFHLARIDYTESLGNKSSARYKMLEREVRLTLNKMLSFYESFLQANVLRFLNGSVIAQSEAVFQGEGFVPTPSDTIRTIVTAVEQREMDTFFDWRVDLQSLRCNGFSLKNLDPEVLAISFTVLGQGSIAAFGGLTDWGPLERQRNEVIWSLGSRYGVQNFSLVQVRNVQGDLDINGEIFVITNAHVDIDWALEALKGLANYSVDLGSVCINGSRLRLQIFPVSFLVTNRIFSEKLLDRSSTAHQSLSLDLSKALMQSLGQYENLLQVTIREVRSGSLICHADVIFQPPAPTSEDLVHALAHSIGPKNYLGASSIQVDPFSFTVAGAKLEPPSANPGIPGYGIALIVLSSLAVIFMPVLVFLYNQFGFKEKMVIHRSRDPEVMVETFELDNPGFRSLSEVNSRQSYSPTEVLG